MCYLASPKDSPSLQCILDRMKDGDTLKLQKGTYRLSAPLVIKKSIHLKGNGRTPHAVRILFPDFTDGILVMDGAPDLKNLTLEGGVRGIYVLTQEKRTSFKKCRVLHSRFGILCESKSRAKFTRCFIASSAESGIYVGKKARPRFRRCAVTRCENLGIQTDPKHKAKFKRCCVFQNDQFSLHVRGSKSVKRCLFSENAHYGGSKSVLPYYVTGDYQTDLKFEWPDWPFQKLIERYCGRTLALILRKHGEDVGGKAIALADRLGLDVDREFLREAAMLHDIGVFLTYRPEIGCDGDSPYICHGFLGAEILRKEGLPKHANVAERHVGTGLNLEFIRKSGLNLPLRDMCPQTLEEELICFADLFFSKSKLGSEKSVEKARKKIKKSKHASLEQFDEWREKFKC